MRYTVLDLAKLVREKERELAPGSETIILGSFVAAYDYVDSIINNDTHLNIHKDITSDYLAYYLAYGKLAEIDKQYAGVSDCDRPYIDPWE